MDYLQHQETRTDRSGRMAFSKLELHAIDTIVGDFCRRRSPAEDADLCRVVYEVQGHAVTVFEEEPVWTDRSTWRRRPVARFRFARRHDEWTLYWISTDVGCYPYPDAWEIDLVSLVAVVDEDKYGAFFG